MVKEFNITLDIKKESINNKIIGLNLNDEVNIKIKFVQNSLPYEINNKDIRIDYRLPNGVLLFQNENTGVTKIDGNTINIKVINQALQQVGDVILDVSIFEKSTSKKITTSKLILKVDSIIYEEEQLSTDFDVLQTALNNSKKLESKFGTATDLHTKLQQDINTGDTLDTTLKQDISNATNIKNTLDTTIDTANKSNSNLQNTINAGDKLKQELNPETYVKNSDYEAYKKEVTTQYEDAKNALNNLGGRNYLLNSSFANGFDNWGKNAENEQNTIKINEQNNVVITNKNTTTLGIHYNIKNIEKGIYTLSIEAKSNTHLEIMCGWSKDSSRIIIEDNEEFKTYSITLKVLQESQAWLVFYTNTPSIVEIKNVKLERGQIATDWTLAPEEVIANSYRLDAIEKILINKGYMTVTQNL